MSEFPDSRELFERHPDIRGLQGPQGPHDVSVNSKLDLFENSPTLMRLSQVPVGGTLRVHSLSAEGNEVEISFRKLPGLKKQGDGSWVKLTPLDGEVIEEPVNMFGSCASPWGTLMEATDDPSIRQFAYFAYAVAYPMRFRHGSEVPGTPHANRKTPEDTLTPHILAQYLDTGYVYTGSDGMLYWNEIDLSKSGEKITGQILAAEVTIEQ